MIRLTPLNKQNNQRVSGNLLLKTISRMRMDMHEYYFFSLECHYSYSVISIGSYQWVVNGWKLKQLT